MSDPTIPVLPAHSIVYVVDDGTPQLHDELNRAVAARRTPGAIPWPYR